MKKLVFLFGMMFLFGNLFGQTIKEVSPGLFGPRYEYNGDVFGGYRLEKILRANSVSHEYLIKSRLYTIVGLPTMTAGAIVVGASFTNSALGESTGTPPTPSEEKAMEKSDRQTLGVGIGLVVVSIPLLMRAKKLKKKALNSFNKPPPKDIGQTEIRLSIDQQGVGFVYVF